MDRVELGMIAGIGLFAVLLIAGMVQAIRNEGEWRTWATDHCKVTGVIAATSATGMGVGAKGEVVFLTTSTPERRVYVCDDGITYTR